LSNDLSQEENKKSSEVSGFLSGGGEGGERVLTNKLAV